MQLAQKAKYAKYTSSAVMQYKSYEEAVSLAWADIVAPKFQMMKKIIVLTQNADISRDSLFSHLAASHYHMVLLAHGFPKSIGKAFIY